MASPTTPSGSGEANFGASIGAGTSTGVSPLEQEVLDEYARLLGNMNRLASTLNDLAGSPTAQILDGLRALERKTSLVFTLLKASVYSIVLQQQIYSGDDEENAGAQGGYDEHAGYAEDAGDTTAYGGGIEWGRG
ncbi:hypothetical protein L228DRAFT_271284 [Xylona heveae TC161]|uniref:DASH complex subunit DAD3 n=1 Tax=Xylona heveae (strain CBS 132557 / TC161) TaxID=1328760 RepID=A0A164ZTF2_XYLHT|nr:hypothetical protein L228DRAFT_271284 [Xylona heveae TC161]KZF19489.1 hypothetical protein L228DRAFT_271284 [Xylona heveae TC161]